jgi:hypothetical protein
MRTAFFFLVALLCAFSAPPARQKPAPPPADAETELSEDIRVEELKAHVYRLTSPDFLGRKGPGAARASQHIADAFQRLKLKPAFGDSYFQPIPWLLADEAVKDGFVGRNVGAMLVGSDPQLKDEWILLSAHFDHLGTTKDGYFPGADDNASGVAMLLEVAERFALQKAQPRRTILFVAFDLEEAGLQGSTHLATKPPRDIGRLKAFLTADMLGRSMGNVMDEYVYAIGSETAPQLRKLIEAVKPGGGLKVGRIGADIVGTRSDYGPFRDRRVPFLFFSTGQHPDYHRPSDLPDRLDYEKLRQLCLWIADLTGHLANDDDAPVWNTQPPLLDLEEVRTMLALVTRALERPKKCRLTPEKIELVSGVRDRLAAILQRGQVTVAERTWIVWTARQLLLSVF